MRWEAQKIKVRLWWFVTRPRFRKSDYSWSEYFHILHVLQPPPACLTQLKVFCILRLLLSMWTTRGCQHLKTPYKQMKRQGLRLWKCNKVVFLECGKQIRLGEGCLVTQTESRLGRLHLCCCSSFLSTWRLVVNQTQHPSWLTYADSGSSLLGHWHNHSFLKYSVESLLVS